MSSHTDRHPHREILVALRGQGFYGFQGRLFPCPPGTVFLLDVFEPHDSHYSAYSPPAVHLWIRVIRDIFWVHFSALEGGRERNLLEGSLILNRPSSGLLLRNLWDRAKAEPAADPALVHAKLGAALLLLLAEIHDRLAYEGGVTAGKSTEEGVLRALMRHVADQGGAGMDVRYLARLAGYSEYYFMRLFKQHTGQTVHQYIDACRLRRARELMRSGVSLKETSARLGFAHASSFSRWWSSHRTNKEDYPS
ncbi:MAG: AraC family transcriptional regulator [Planctomycetota bacterium]|nr:AraC family transcriptional regulator [Planctomycetota bacterium]